MNQPPAKPPREFWLIPYYDEFDCLSWERSITPPDETSTVAKDVEPIRVVDADYADRLEQRVAELTEAIVFSLRGLQMWRTYQSPGNIAEVEQRLRQALKREGGSDE